MPSASPADSSAGNSSGGSSRVHLGAGPSLRSRIVPLLPGLAVAGALTLLALAVHAVVPAVSPLLVAILAGAVVANVRSLPARTAPGLAVASKPLLRAGIVLLGLQIALGDILGLGAGVLGIVVAVVAIGISATLLAGRILRVAFTQSALIACGFSICGAAAVAGAAGTVEDATEEETATAVALVVLFGTLMIPLLPLAAALIGLAPEATAVWTGASVHEVAQVVAIGGALGPEPLGVAVVVKLARVIMLAPALAALVLLQRRRSAQAGSAGSRAPLVPLFVIGFLVAVAVRSLGILPEPALGALGQVQTVLLTAAMAALGTGVLVSRLRTVGGAPFALAAIATVVVSATALIGVALTG